ncbi:MAG: flagellar hook-associated protein FlgK [Bdellovibrionales bacterium]
MPKLTGIMGIGRRSLANSQVGLQTVSHNIANKSTEGFSRQRIEQATTPSLGTGGRQVGTGATVKAVRSIKNDYLEKQIQSEMEKLGYNEGQAESMARVEQVFNEQINGGLNRFVGEFFNAFRELASSPESAATRTLVKESAKAVTRDFGRVNSQLVDVQKDIDRQIESEVQIINSYTTEIADLNEKISQIEIRGAIANDSRDRRDLLLKKLGEKIDIKYAENEEGQVTVMAGSTATLVSGFSQNELTVSASPGFNGHRYGEARVIFLPTENSTEVDITKQLKGGKIGAALEVRDIVIDGLLKDLDEVAFSMANEVNALHIQGKDRSGRDGVLFFENFPTGKLNSAANLRINETIDKDVSRIAAAQGSFGLGDNRVANKISELQYSKVLNNGTSTFDDFYTSVVGTVAVDVNKVNAAAKHQKEIVSQLSNIRESISGVSIDEETTKMIELQKSFDASARLIRAADEMFDTILSLKRY